jgi:hypothetical protein
MTQSEPVVVQGTPVVVQGTPVSAPATSTQQYSTNVQSDVTNGNWEGKGEKQPNRCRDPIFAILLYANLAAIIAVAAALGQGAFENITIGGDYLPYMYAVLICCGFSLFFSFLVYLFMMRFPETLVKTSLIFVVILSLVWCIMAFLSGSFVAGIFGAIFFFIGVCYARAVWSRIPFATSNLITAATAIKHNCGVTGEALLAAIFAAGWSFLWAIAFFGVWEDTYKCDANGNCSLNYGYLFLMFLSYFFTHQVIQNTLHVSVAGAVGTWWFAPEESGCCASGVRDSCCRALTTSFGSICFGSLLVAIIRALQQLANTARQEGDAGILACIAECILACLANLVEYFNQWAFVYVGLYGYGYLEAGKNVITLFKNRGWEAIIADDLVGNTLFLMSVIVGGLSGIVGLLLDVTTDYFATAPGNTRLVAFLLGFTVGIVLCSIILSTVSSGVNTVIVLFAEAPAEFQQNYPELSNRMRETWQAAFPGCLQ